MRYALNVQVAQVSFRKIKIKPQMMIVALFLELCKIKVKQAEY
jgi:hypothetical protein